MRSQQMFSRLSMQLAKHYENLREWFSCLYETMLGQAQGPRMGSFFRLYGLQESVVLCDKVLEDQLAEIYLEAEDNNG